MWPEWGKNKQRIDVYVLKSLPVIGVEVIVVAALVEVVALLVATTVLVATVVVTLAMGTFPVGCTN